MHKNVNGLKYTLIIQILKNKYLTVTYLESLKLTRTKSILLIFIKSVGISVRIANMLTHSSLQDYIKWFTKDIIVLNINQNEMFGLLYSPLENSRFINDTV